MFVHCYNRNAYNFCFEKFSNLFLTIYVLVLYKNKDENIHRFAQRRELLGGRKRERGIEKEFIDREIKTITPPPPSIIKHDITWQKSGDPEIDPRIYRICAKANQKEIDDNFISFGLKMLR